MILNLKQLGRVAVSGITLTPDEVKREMNLPVDAVFVKKYKEPQSDVEFFVFSHPSFEIMYDKGERMTV
jgi:hypothetical protein